METPEFTTLEEFARHVRNETQSIMGSCLNGNAKSAGERAALLCTASAKVIQQKKMREEVTTPNRYNLATLPAPAPLDPDADTPE